MKGLFYLALAWALWCAAHSLLLWPPVREPLERRLGWSAAGYRLAYSLLSLVSIVPPLYAVWSLGGLWPYLWPGAWLWPQLLLMAAAAGLIVWADRTFARGGYDMMGAAEALSGEKHAQPLVIAGPYTHTRHPMHLAAVVLVWCRGLSPADLAVNLVLTAYLILGTVLEELRMREQFGEAYLAYARRVPVIPFLK